MKLKVLQENFNKALSLASRFSSTKAQLPVLENVLLSAKNSKLLISATNLEASVAISVGAKIDKSGQITIPAKTISDIVTNLNSGPITLVSEKEQLKITSDGFSSTISGMNVSDFPKIPNKIEKKEYSLPMEAFLKALSQVIFASSVDETRPILTGILFIFQKDLLTLVATDGFRLSQKRLPLNGKRKIKEQKIILPKGALTELSRFSKEYENFSLDFREKDNQVVFGFPDVVFSSRVLEGEFPNFERIIPKSSQIKINSDKEELLKAVKLASVFARDSANIVKVSVTEDGVRIYAESSRSGSQETEVDAKVESQIDIKEKEFEIAFNFRFLEEFLHVVEGEEVQVEFSGTTSPGVFRDPKDKNYLHLIMPVRIQS